MHRGFRYPFLLPFFGGISAKEGKMKRGIQNIWIWLKEVPVTANSGKRK